MRSPIGFAAATAFSGLLALTLVSMPAQAQRGGRGGDSTAGRGLPLTPTHQLKFTTDEGTWLSLDLSPEEASQLAPYQEHVEKPLADLAPAPGTQPPGPRGGAGLLRILFGRRP